MTPRQETVGAEQCRPNIDSKHLKMLRMSDLVHLLNISRSTIYNLLKEGAFPVPLKFGKRGIIWPASEIETWLAGKARASSTKAGGGDE